MMRVLFLILLLSSNLQSVALAAVQKEIPRAIISDDFTKNRPKSRKNAPKRPRTYRLTSTIPAEPVSGFAVPVGVTLWRVEYVPVARSPWIGKRVEADTQFARGEFLRMSIESPRAGYLYVIDRDWFENGGSGET